MFFFFTINKKNKWITNIKSRKISHILRNDYDCIISTSKSINSDNSLLNCRISGLNNNRPDLFIIDLNLKLRKNLLLNTLLKKRKTFLVTSKNNFKHINMGSITVVFPFTCFYQSLFVLLFLFYIIDMVF